MSVHMLFSLSQYSVYKVITFSAKVSLSVVRKPPCMEAEIVDESQNPNISPCLQVFK